MPAIQAPIRRPRHAAPITNGIAARLQPRNREPPPAGNPTASAWLSGSASKMTAVTTVGITRSRIRCPADRPPHPHTIITAIAGKIKDRCSAAGSPIARLNASASSAVTGAVAARYAVDANIPTSRTSATLIDTVKSRSIQLRQQRDAPELRVFLHIFGNEVAGIDQQVPDAVCTQHLDGGAPNAGRRIGVRFLRRVGDRHPAAVRRQNLNLYMRFENVGAFEQYFV